MIICEELETDRAEMGDEATIRWEVIYDFSMKEVCEWTNRLPEKLTRGSWRFLLTHKSENTLNLHDQIAERIKHQLFHSEYRIRFFEQQYELEKQFNELASQWHEDTRKLSSLHQIVIHAAYQKIIGMGKDALPFIFRDLQMTRGHWLWALYMITREDNGKPGGTFRESVDSWLKWGEEMGYI